MFGLLQLCIQFMTEEQVVTLIGRTRLSQLPNGWITMQPEQFIQQYSMSIIGGSSVKPTSQAKKEEAIQIAQVLGQFEVPGIVEIILNLFERAFDEINMTDEDWAMLRQSIQMSQQQAGAGPQGQQQQQPGQSGELPPEAQQIVQQLVQRGIPEDQAVQVVRQRLGEQAQ
jgi:hypothetical protein